MQKVSQLKLLTVWVLDFYIEKLIEPGSRNENVFIAARKTNEKEKQCEKKENKNQPFEFFDDELFLHCINKFQSFNKLFYMMVFIF